MSPKPKSIGAGGKLGDWLGDTAASLRLVATSVLGALGRDKAPKSPAAGASRLNGKPVPQPPAGTANSPRGNASPASTGKSSPLAASAGPQRKGREGVLAVTGLQKGFKGRQVVRGVTLGVRRGEAVGLLGPNGAGKTTCFYMITGLIQPDAGRIELDGYDITATPMYRRARLGIGYLPQEASIFRGLSVENNIRAVLEVVEPSRKERERQLDALLEEFSITHLRKQPSIALSGGERRRCEIARALATRPTFMLLDEPFAGIDPISIGDIQELVRHLTRRGIGVLITDHNVRETLGLIDRAYIIASGQVLTHGRPDEIVRNPDVRRTYLGEQFTL
ncbi:MAG: LPS export ABC transporter ATP-binding protein [Nitratireductor sp.]